jgi:uncharacterized protein YaaQ
MKLVITIVSKEDANKVTKALINNNFFVTKLSSTGGFLRGGNVTLMTGINENDVEQAIKIIGDCCKSRKEYIANQFVGEYNTVITAPIEITVGGATIFVLDVEQFHKV